MNRLVLSVTLLLVAGPVSAQRPASPAESDTAGGQPQAKGPREPQYLIFWGPPEQVLELKQRLGSVGDGKSRWLAFGLPNTTFDGESTLPHQIRQAFQAAREHGIAVHLHFDFHIAWKGRPDLWNCFDAKLPGYNPANARNVEWSDWNGTPNKVRYLNWGVPERIAPQMCVTSPVIRQEITRMVSKVIGPALKSEIDRLKKEGKEHLFAGITVGSEPGIEDYSHPDPETARLMEQDGTPKTPLGFNALASRGYSEMKPPKDFRRALAEVNQDFVAFCAKQFVDAGIPSSRLYTHVPAQPPQESTTAPIGIAFNKYSRPGWSTYPVGPLGADFGVIYAELEKHGSPPWGGVEANAGFPGSTVGWEAYLARHFNHGAVLVGINCGASGSTLPAQLTKSAFGDEAVAAYKKFLAGSPLESETENTNDNPQARLQEKMQKFHAGLQKWQQEGRDLSPIMRIMPEFEPLMRQGKLPEAEALLDRALEILGSAAKIKDEDVSGGKVGPFDRAQWIWCAGEQVPKNFYLYCRKTFTLKENVASATIHVTADSRYKLYVNGTFVGRGPARADQRWQYYDSYDVASHLRAGENVIAAIVHQYGVPTHSYTLGRGGFLLQGEAGGQILDTGRSWKVLPSPSWQRPTPRISPAIMWMEVYDARKEPVGWKTAGFDGSGWSPARELGRPPVNPWKNLVPRDIPFLLEKETFPTKILDQGTVEPIEEKEVARRLAREPHHPGPAPGLKDAGKLLKSGDGPAVVCTDKADVYATIDFGKEVSGYVRLRLKGVAGGIVDLGYSEVLRDGRVDVGREGPWGFADRYIMRDGPQEWELFFWKGFRYLQLTFRNCPKPVEVESASLLFTSYPVQYRGKFECSDAKLNRIWEVGRWTLQLCMHDGYEDTPWREQGQWVGDAQVEMMANYLTFGDVALGSKCLRQIAEGQAPDGSLPAMYPAATMPSEGGIPTFMCQWVSSLLDHYRYTGERKLVTELYPSVKRLMGYFDRHLDDHGLLAGVPGFVFLDWSAAPPSQTGVELTGLNCHYYRALLDAAELALIEKDEAKRTQWLSKAERVKQSLNQRLWSEKKGAYLPGLSGGKPLPQFTVHDTVLAIWSGIASPEHIQRGLAALREADPQEFSFIGTPYFYYFYLGALRRAGEHRAAVEITRAAYGQMLQEGATSWWEHFSGMASRSHAWSCAPNFDLPAYVLGVQPTRPGFDEFRVEPHPSGLDWAKGTVPTVRGDIHVQWKRDGQEVELVVDVPMKARAELVLPAGRRWVTGPGTFRLKSAAAKDKPASLVKTLITHRNAVVFPGQGEGPPPSLQQKMQSLQEAAQKWQAEGKDLSPVGKLMQDFEPLMRAGKFREAEAVLDRALEKLGLKTKQKTKEGMPGGEPAKKPRITKPRPAREEQGSTEPQYLLFQLFTYMCDGSQKFNRAPLRKIIDEILESLGGLRGDGKNRHLGFAWGPLTLDQTDDELREIIREAFRIADEKEVAVAFHIDDSMFWLRRSDLWKDPKNVEWTDWQGTVHPQRYVGWVSGPKLAPQMCYNSPTLRKEISRIAKEVIGAEVNKGIAVLKAKGKDRLFAGVIAGWETHLADFSTYGNEDPRLVEQMKRDGSPRVRIGYNALTNLGFSQTNPPKDIQRELDKVVHDWAEFWTSQLNQAGIPKDRIYTHFASNSCDWKAFNACSRPGFSAYDTGQLAAAYQALAQNGGTRWAVAEGTNLDEAALGVTWEAYLGRIFNHGGTLATIFAWHEKAGSPYGRATNSKGAIAAYKKFLKGERLSEEVRESELTNFQRKTRQISAALPAYVGKGGDAAKVMPLVQKLGQCVQQGRTEEAEKAADEILKLIQDQEASGVKRDE